MVQEEDHPSSYNINEIFGSFTFNLHKKEVNRKRVRKVKHDDGTLEEMQEDDILFKKTDEDPMIVVTDSTTLAQATAHNVTILNQNLSQAKYENVKLKDEIISLREEMNK